MLHCNINEVSLIQFEYRPQCFSAACYVLRIEFPRRSYITMIIILNHISMPCKFHLNDIPVSHTAYSFKYALKKRWLLATFQRARLIKVLYMKITLSKMNFLYTVYYIGYLDGNTTSTTTEPTIFLYVYE